MTVLCMYSWTINDKNTCLIGIIFGMKTKYEIDT